MANYLLLRDNKETGPYSLDELLKLNLKAYDLVWVEGKSAAWRYPGEVAELKPYAPGVEEQPYDRFFRRNIIEEEQPKTVQEEKPSVSAPNKVFVTLPEQRKEIKETIIPKKEVTEPVAVIPPAQDNTYQRIRTITVTENPVAAEVKYAQPLDEIKEMYVQTLQHRKQKIARKDGVMRNLKRASVVLYLVALGVLIGLTLKPSLLKKTNSAKTSISGDKTVDPLLVQPSQEIPSAQGVSDADNTSQQQAATISPEIKSPKVENHSAQKTARPNAEDLRPGNTTASQKGSSNQNNPSVEVNAVTGERNKTTRNDGNAAASSTKENISSLVSVKSNDYKRGAFGGIRDLQLTVSNNSNYILDNVVVELQYLKPSEQPLKTENISFNSVAPKGSMTIAIPPTKRGVKVAFRIVKIESKELND